MHFGFSGGNKHFNSRRRQRTRGLVIDRVIPTDMPNVENTFNSTYIIKKEKYAEIVAGAQRLAIAVYTIPTFVWRELYQMIDTSLLKYRPPVPEAISTIAMT